MTLSFHLYHILCILLLQDLTCSISLPIQAMIVHLELWSDASSLASALLLPIIMPTIRGPTLNPTLGTLPISRCLLARFPDLLFQLTVAWCLLVPCLSPALAAYEQCMWIKQKIVENVLFHIFFKQLHSHIAMQLLCNCTWNALFYNCWRWIVYYLD